MPRQKVSKEALTYLRNIKRELAAGIGARVGTSVARSTYKRFKSMPLRFRSGKRTYKKNQRMLSKMPMAERKPKSLTNQDEAPPVPIAVGAQAFVYQTNLGNNTPATWSGTWTPLGGFQYPQGTGNNQRVGRYMYLDKTTMNMSIHMNASERLYAPTQFRMIVFRARRATTPTGISYNPQRTLFLRPSGDLFGSAGDAVLPGNPVNFNDLYLQPTNKRDWIIVKDMKFTLSSFLADGQPNTAAWQGKYPNFKTFRLIFNHGKKTSFDNTSNEPEDFDYHYGVVIFAGSVGRDQVANNWEVNIRGTTTAVDN